MANDTIKLLNDQLVQCAKLLEAWRNDEPIAEDIIDMTLQETSEVLAMVPKRERRGVTWEYTNPAKVCEDGTCSWVPAKREAS